MAHRLRVVVRSDLAPGAQLAQALHAAVDFQHRYPLVSWCWRRRSNTVVVLSVEKEHQLQVLLDLAKNRGVRAVAFNESDLNNALTAIALEPGEDAQRLCESLPLALKPK